jgi:hypothetical protein
MGTGPTLAIKRNICDPGLIRCGDSAGAGIRRHSAKWHNPMAKREIIDTLGILEENFLASGERPVVTLEFEENSAKKGRLLVCIAGTPIAEHHKGKWQSLGPIAFANHATAKIEVIDIDDIDGDSGIELRIDGKPMSMSARAH